MKPCEDSMKQFIGALITNVYYQEKGEALYLETDNGTFELTLAADCCSESWWSDICMHGIIGKRIVEIHEVQLPPPRDNRSRQESDDHQMYIFISDNKYNDGYLAWRNSSNGYYSGWLLDPKLVKSVPADAKKAESLIVL